MQRQLARTRCGLNKNIFIRKRKISKCSMEGQEPKIMFNKSKWIRSRKLKVEQQAYTTGFQAADSGHFSESQWSQWAAISLIRSVLRCTTASTMTEQSLYLSTTRLPQDVKYKRSTSGALPLASTFKCEFVARTMSLSSCEPLAGAARQEAASGEPSSGRHKKKLIGSRPSVPCFCNKSLLSNSSAPAGCRRAGWAQGGTKQLHPT